jgi:cyanophycinase
MLKPAHFQYRTISLLALGLMACASAPELSAADQSTLHTIESRRLIEAMPPVSNIIAGGGLVNCSSMNGANDDKANKKCALPWVNILQQDPAFANMAMDDISFETAITHPTFTYSITKERIAAFDALPSSLLSDAAKTLLMTKLRAQLDDITKNKTAISFSALDALLSNIPSKLPMTELAALRHSFVDEIPATRSKRKVQARSVAFLTNQASVDIYRAFVHAAMVVAGGKKPTVGLVTASAENPFNDHDIYYSALRSAGANVVWLPADGGLRKALDRKDCEHIAIDYAAYASQGSERQYFHMDKIFPDLAEQQKQFCLNDGAKFNATLTSLHGIFFTGGNQTRHLDSFISRNEHGAHTKISPQLEILRQRFAAGQLVVAGSSAGDAVQSGGTWKGKAVPMIGGGESWKVLANGFIKGGDPTVERPAMRGTLYPAGGLGFFQFGPLDSHFSQRAREARLVRLVSESGLDYGFGVDENTALIVSKPDTNGKTTMVVIGAAGVFVMDARNAKPIASEAYGISNLTIHYLTTGDALSIDSLGKLTVQLSANKQILPLNSSAPIVRQQNLLAPKGMHFLKMTQVMGQSGAAFAFGTSEGSQEKNMPLFSFSLSRKPDTIFRDGADGKLSYTNLSLAITPCTDTCHLPE